MIAERFRVVLRIGEQPVECQTVDELVSALLQPCERVDRAIRRGRAAIMQARDESMKLGRLLLDAREDLRAAGLAAEWSRLCHRLPLHAKRVQRCVRLAVLGDTQGRVSPTKVDARRMQRLAEMPAKGREYWRSQPLFTTPPDRLSANQLMRIMGVLPLPNLEACGSNDVPARPAAAVEPAPVVIATRVPSASTPVDNVVRGDVDNAPVAGPFRREELAAQQMSMLPLFEQAEQVRHELGALVDRAVRGELGTEQLRRLIEGGRQLISQIVGAAAHDKPLLA